MRTTLRLNNDLLAQAKARGAKADFRMALWDQLKVDPGPVQGRP
jgi:hypothetical protein